MSAVQASKAAARPGRATEAAANPDRILRETTVAMIPTPVGDTTARSE
jgi:hypothetical protein